MFPNGSQIFLSYNFNYKIEGESKEKFQYTSEFNFLGISRLIVDLTLLFDAIIVLDRRRLRL